MAICTLWAGARQGKLGEVAMVLIWIAFVVRVGWCSCGGLVGWLAIEFSRLSDSGPIHARFK